MQDKKRLIVGISGASGVILGYEILKVLASEPGWESLLVLSDAAKSTFEYETDIPLDEVKGKADYIFDFNDIAANISSGTYETEGMIIAPCSMKTLAGIASGYSDNLLLRAADVVLKERRKLVLCVRESPFSQIHLRNMYEASKVGAIIIPPMLTLYNKPESVDDIVRHITGKLLSPFGIKVSGFRAWGGDA